MMMRRAMAGVVVMAAFGAAASDVAYAAERFVFACRNGVRVSHSELNERNRDNPGNNLGYLGNRPIGDTLSLLQDDASKSFIVQYASAGTHFIRQADQPEEFRIRKTGPHTILIDFTRHPRTGLIAWHNLVFYRNRREDYRLIHNWRLVRTGESTAGPASGLEIFSCNAGIAFRQAISEIPGFDDTQ